MYCYHYHECYARNAAIYRPCLVIARMRTCSLWTRLSLAALWACWDRAARCFTDLVKYRYKFLFCQRYRGDHVPAASRHLYNRNQNVSLSWFYTHRPDVKRECVCVLVISLCVCVWCSGSLCLRCCILGRHQASALPLFSGFLRQRCEGNICTRDTIVMELQPWRQRHVHL